MLSALLGVAVSVGIVHTLAGPDHYLPLIAAAKARGWSARRTLLTTIGCGVLHCCMSFVMLCIASPLWIEALRGKLAAAALIATGLALAIASTRRSSQDSQKSSQESSQESRKQSLQDSGERRFAGPLLLVFALGPCEWLLPAGAAAWAEHGFLGALQVSLVFSFATIATMAAVVMLGVQGLARLSVAPHARARVGAFAGMICSLCGVSMLFGW